MTINAPWIDPYLAEIENRDARMYSDLLEEMVKFPQLHEKIAQHSRTPNTVLQRIANQTKFENLPHRLFENPNCPRDLIERVINENTSDFIDFVAINENLTRDDLTKLIQRKDLSSWLSGRMNMDSDHFIYLWENYLVDRSEIPYRINLQLLGNLACNPSTPLKILKNIAKYRILDKDEYLIQSYLMSNPALPDVERAKYALLGIKAEKNLLDNDDTGWYPTNLLFDISDFPDKYLELLSELGHPKGLLRSNSIPPSLEELDYREIFNLWREDQSIYKTLWPELEKFKDINGGGLEFQYCLNYGNGFTFFECGLEIDVYDYDEDFGYHVIPGAPIWLPFEGSFTEASSNFNEEEFSYAVEWGGTSDWLQAWALSDPEQNLVTLTEFGEDFVIEVDMDRLEDDRSFQTNLVESAVAPYGWKKLSSEKKEFLIELIKNAYKDQEDGFWQYAEHFLICIGLNPNTPKELLDRHFMDIESQLIQQAIGLRG